MTQREAAVESVAREITIETMKRAGFWATLPTPSAQKRAVDIAFPEAIPLARAAIAAHLSALEAEGMVRMIHHALREALVERPEDHPEGHFRDWPNGVTEIEGSFDLHVVAERIAAAIAAAPKVES